jgi:hypothetical protein
MVPLFLQLAILEGSLPANTQRKQPLTRISHTHLDDYTIARNYIASPNQYDG